MNDVRMIYKEKPSALLTLWKAFRSRKSLYSPGATTPVIHAERPGLAIGEKHLRDFHQICNIPPSPFLHIMYPYTLVYPYLMRVLCMKEMPISLFRSLNTRTSILMHRAIRHDERIDIDCCNSAQRIVPKGLEIDMKCTVASGGKTVWENITTYFYPGKFGGVDPSYSTPKLDAIPEAPVIREWYFPAKDRFRFALVSGDTNGIHYGSFYARMMGFKRDFTQPIRVVAQCVSYLPVIDSRGPVRLDFHLKGPVYYESTLTLRNLQRNNSSRFDLYCSGNEKPCISGLLNVSGA
jgi:hypothetical protein